MVLPKQGGKKKKETQNSKCSLILVAKYFLPSELLLDLKYSPSPSHSLNPF